jgi:FKBP-type peptidyl-prolyl cis-trans isomerase 2
MFVVGTNQVIQGLDEGIVGMKIGKSKTITITPDKGYGKLYQKQNVQKVGKLIFDAIGIVPEVGKMQKLDSIE